MTDHYYPNAKNVAGLGDPVAAAACEALMAARNTAQNASWDLYACGAKALPRPVSRPC